jgi:DNA-binding CsgD family transcriptional regulator
MDEIEHLYAEGLTQAQIAEKLGVAKQTVWRRMRRLGLVARSHSERGCGASRIAIPEERLHQGGSTREIADDLGVSEETVRRRMIELGIERLPGHARPEKNAFWLGGKPPRRDYKRIYVPDHPHAKQSGTVLEHRLVMEAHLGRYLLPTEVVHHEDGDVRNNDLGNLRLFGSQTEHMRYHLSQQRLAQAQVARPESNPPVSGSDAAP